MDFQPGDLVRLKSGGPSMTVDSLGDYLGSEAVYVIWVEKVGPKQVVQRDSFPPHTLEKVERGSGLTITRG